MTADSQLDEARRHTLRCGAFIPPFSRRDMDPTLALHREFELVEHLDRLGYDEAWIGEHHSGGIELIASPELFIAAAAERTRRIRLGTGVISLPYHHPLMVADRMVQLDHQTRGRAMFGVGAGLLTSDAKMLGIPTDKQRDRMVESLEVILRLLDGEVVTHHAEWFQLESARLHLSSYSRPRPPIAVASAVTPTGGKLAGQHGLGLLALAATSAQGFAVLGTNWEIAQREAAAHQQTLSRSEYRLVAPFHIAETRTQALTEVRDGFEEWADYTRHVSPIGPAALGMDSLDFINESGNGAIGTPDDALKALNRFWDQSGGFGCILHFGQNWANAEATKRSYAMFAEYVMPMFARRNARRLDSLQWLGDNVSTFSAASKDAADKSIAKHTAEGEARGALRTRNTTK